METYSKGCCEGCGNGRKKFTGLFFLFFIIHLFTIHFIVDWLAGWLVDRQCTNRWVYVYSSCFAHVWYHVRSICMVYFQNISDNNSSAILCSILINYIFFSSNFKKKNYIYFVFYLHTLCLIISTEQQMAIVAIVHTLRNFLFSLKIFKLLQIQRQIRRKNRTMSVAQRNHRL